MIAAGRRESRNKRHAVGTTKTADSRFCDGNLRLSARFLGVNCQSPMRDIIKAVLTKESHNLRLKEADISVGDPPPTDHLPNRIHSLQVRATLM
jgi:hypothetical protein